MTHNGHYNIDTDPEIFTVILNWLRYQKVTSLCLTCIVIILGLRKRDLGASIVSTNLFEGSCLGPVTHHLNEPIGICSGWIFWADRLGGPAGPQPAGHHLARGGNSRRERKEDQCQQVDHWQPILLPLLTNDPPLCRSFLTRYPNSYLAEMFSAAARYTPTRYRKVWLCVSFYWVLIQTGWWKLQPGRWPGVLYGHH